LLPYLAVSETDVLAPAPSGLVSRCPICSTAVTENAWRCPRCQTPHHSDCVDYHHACGVYACAPREATGLPCAAAASHALAVARVQAGCRRRDARVCLSLAAGISTVFAWYAVSGAPPFTIAFLVVPAAVAVEVLVLAAVHCLWGD